MRPLYRQSKYGVGMVCVGSRRQRKPGHLGEGLIVGVSRAIDVDAGLFARTLDREKQEGLVLLHRPADGSAELLAAERSLLPAAAVRGLLEVVQRVEDLIAVLKEDRPVKNVGAGLGDHVHRRAFAAPVGGRKPLRGDIEFLNGFEGKLHDGPAHRVVLVVDAVHGHVHVASAGSIGGEDAVTGFGWVVRRHWTGARRENRQIDEIARVKRKIFHFRWRDRLTDIRFFKIDQRSAAGFNRYCLGLLARRKLRINGRRATDKEFHILIKPGRESLHRDANLINARWQKIEHVEADVIAYFRALQTGRLIVDGHLRARNHRSRFVGHGALQSGRRCRLGEHVRGTQARQCESKRQQWNSVSHVNDPF